MATPPYNVAVRAYATGGDSDSPVVESHDPNYTIATPANVTLTRVSGQLKIEWDYTPEDEDGLSGFKVWISHNPTPDWDTAVDNGLDGGDGAAPTQGFTYQHDNTLVGVLFVLIQAYDSEGGTAVSSRAQITWGATLPDEINVDGLTDVTGRVATGLTVNPIGGTTLMKLNDVNVPTLDDLVAGTGMTITKSGRTATFASTGGGGGDGNINGAYDIEAGSYTDAGLSDECEGGSIDASWTVATGTSGTVNLVGTQSAAIYDRSTRSKGMLVQTPNSGTNSFSIRAPMIASGEQLILSISAPHASANDRRVSTGIICTSTTTSIASDIVSRCYLFSDGGNIYVRSSGTTTLLNPTLIPSVGTRVYFRVIRTGGYVQYFFSIDGIAWSALAGIAEASHSYIWIFVTSPTFTRQNTGDPITCINWIRHNAYTGLDPW